MWIRLDDKKFNTDNIISIFKSSDNEQIDKLKREGKCLDGMFEITIITTDNEKYKFKYDSKEEVSILLHELDEILNIKKL